MALPAQLVLLIESLCKISDLCCCDKGKTKSTPNLTWALVYDWSLTPYVFVFGFLVSPKVVYSPEAMVAFIACVHQPFVC